MIASIAYRPTFAAPPSTPTASRPEVDWWNVGDKRYDSTADLLKGSSVPADGLDATYHFRHETQHSRTDTFWDTTGGVLAGAAIGAGVLVAGAAILGVAGSILNGLMLGAFNGSGGFSMLGVAGVGAALGGFLGGAAGRSSSTEGFEQGVTVSGKVLNQARPDGSTHSMFYPGGQLQNGVDLDEYAKAPAVATAGSTEAVPRWRDALKGAALGAAVPLSALVPLAGPFLPMYMLSKAGGALDCNAHRGGVLGGTAGAALTVGVYAGMNLLQGGVAGLPGWAIAAGVVGAAAVAGAVAGPRVLPQLRQEKAAQQVYEGQWWGQYEKSQAVG